MTTINVNKKAIAGASKKKQLLGHGHIPPANKIPLNTENRTLYTDALDESGSNFLSLLSKLQFAQKLIQDKQSLAGKHAVGDFNYEEELKHERLPLNGESAFAALANLGDMIQGAMRPQSSLSVHNMVPNPMFDSVVAQTMMQLYNVNAIMDSYGGKTLLYEQKVARQIGHLIDWPQAFGISCNGGKNTLFYAMKAALLKIAPDHVENGVPDDVVILTSTGTHYSIEHVASLVGLGSNKVIRVKTNEQNQLCEHALKQAFQAELDKGHRVALIIAAGGTTLDFIADDTTSTFQAVMELCQENQLSYRPHLHCDTVIGWLWFSYLGLSYQEILAITGSHAVSDKIMLATARFAALKKFDSCAIDMHKNGFCPYASSFFICRDKNDITADNRALTSMHYGDVKAYRYTLDNSRPASGIASSYIALKRLGLSGLRTLLASLLKCALKLKSLVKEDKSISVLNDASLGFEVIVRPNFKKLDANHPQAHLVENFIARLWQKVNQGKVVANVGLIQDFIARDSGHPQHGLIIYNMKPDLSTNQAHRLVKSLQNEISQFEDDVLKGHYTLKSIKIEKPIR